MTDNDKFEHDIFLSYTGIDEEWAGRLYARLKKEFIQGRKLRVFFAPKSIRPGDSFIKEYEAALTKSRKLGLIMTPEAMDSGGVESERLSVTMRVITDKEYLIIPLYLRTCKIPPLLSHIQFIDFRNESKFEDSYRMLLAIIRDETLPDESDQTDVSIEAMPVPIPRRPSVGFVPRQNKQGEDLVQKIVNMLVPEQNQLVALCGRGGLGKTTLAAEAVKVMRGAFDNRIAWTSADGRKDFSISTLLDDIASQFGRIDLRQLPTKPKKEAVRAVLAEEPALVVLDNFETVSRSERENCLSWLAHSALFSALITTREKTPPARYFPVDPMLIDEARDFCERLIEQADETSTFVGLDIVNLIEIAEYNPLIIGWVVGQIDLAQSYDEILNDLSHGKGEAAERVFDRSFELEQLTDDGRDTLLALSLFVPSTSRIALAEVAGFSGDAARLNEAVRRLAALRMVKSLDKGNRLAVEGLTRDFAAARLSKDARADEFRQRFTQYFLSYSEEHKEHNPENHDALESEKDNLLSAIDTAFSQQDWPTVMRLVEIVGWQPVSVLYLRGYWSEATRCGEQALKAVRESKSESKVAPFTHNLAIAYQSQGELNGARKLYDESLEINKKLGNQNGIALTLGQMGRLAEDEGDKKEAARLYNDALIIFERLGSPYAKLA